MKERYVLRLRRSAVLVNPSVAPFPPRIPASSQRANTVANAPPITCPQMKSGTLSGDIPAKVSVIARPNVTAGLANEVEEVNQYALVMKAAMAIGIASARNFAASEITRTSAECGDDFVKSFAQGRSNSR